MCGFLFDFDADARAQAVKDAKALRYASQARQLSTWHYRSAPRQAVDYEQRLKDGLSRAGAAAAHAEAARLRVDNAVLRAQVETLLEAAHAAPAVRRRRIAR